MKIKRYSADLIFCGYRSLSPVSHGKVSVSTKGTSVPTCDYPGSHYDAPEGESESWEFRRNGDEWLRELGTRTRGAGGDEDLRVARSAIFSPSVHFSPLRAELFVSQ